MNKKVKTRKRGVMFVVFLIGILFSVTFISAFSVGMPYMENKQLYLSAGDTRGLEFVLQNSGGTVNSNAKARIIEGSEIIEITDLSDVYVVVPGEQTKVNFRITIPEDAQIGDSYHIKLDFSSEAGAGGFAFGSAIEQNFDVIIGERLAPAVQEEGAEKETSLKSFLPYGVLIIVLMVVLIVFFAIRKRKK